MTDSNTPHHIDNSAASHPQQTDDFDRGLKNRRSVLGDAWVDRSLDNANTFNAEFQSLITRFAWNDIWSRPGLDHTTRRLLVLGMTAGMGRWEEFELHFKAAVMQGVPLSMLKETLMQSAIYCGVPAANTSFKIAMDVLKELGMAPAPAPLSASVRASEHHTFSQPQLHVTVQGEGTPVVMSHALGLDLQIWDGLAADLASTHQVLRYDHRGHGASAVPHGNWTLSDMVDDAARVIREWGRGPVVFIGLSMGGMVAQGLAIRYPELVRGLVLANTTAQYPDTARAMWNHRVLAVESEGIASIADMVMQRYFNDAWRDANPQAMAAYRQVLVKTSPIGYATACKAVSSVDWLGQLPTISAPTLVIAGADDMGTPVAMAQEIANRVPGAQLVVLKDASHLSVVEQPAAFADAVKAFLAKL
ncbi:MAG: alpha/beta fold hydrolase [Rhizobacter sp.]|nr:alpha/beta fold hydrolase [Rhizobacter sp.]